MKDKTKFCLAFMVIIAIWICLLPVVILAESTYIDLENTDVFVYQYSNNSGDTWYGYVGSNYNDDIRAVIYKVNGSNNTYASVIARYTGNYAYFGYTMAKNNPTPTVGYYNRLGSYADVEGNRYQYILKFGIQSYSGWETIDYKVPVLQLDHDMTFQELYEYTFGAPEPTPTPIPWGLLKNVSFSQRTRGTGYINYRHNLDYISWNPEQDSNGNLLTDCQVQIRAHTGFWSASEYDDFLGMDKRDLIGLEDTFVDLGTYSADVGQVAVSWERILNNIAEQGLTVNGKTFDIPGIIPVEETAIGDFWTKFGWWYEVRLVPPEMEPMRWQEVYTPMGTSVKDSNTIVNNNNVTNEVLNVYQTVTQLNNQTQTTIIYNDNTVTVVNPDNEPQYDTPGDLYSDILRKILNAVLNLPTIISDGITQIVNNIQSLPDLFMDSIESLIKLPDTYDGSLAQRFDEEYNQYLEEKQPTIYDFLEGVDDVQSYITGFVPEEEGMHTCIIRWDDVTLNLSMFNAGTVTFIQHGEHNLTYTLYTILQAFHMSYSDYQTLVSGIIYLWLLVFIWHHFIKFLEKD